MKTPDPDHNPRWNDLVRRARADAHPSIDLPSLLRSVRVAQIDGRTAAAGVTGPTDWVSLLLATFSPVRATMLLVGVAGALSVVAGWQAWETWQALAWVEFAGGAL